MDIYVISVNNIVFSGYFETEEKARKFAKANEILNYEIYLESLPSDMLL